MRANEPGGVVRGGGYGGGGAGRRHREDTGEEETESDERRETRGVSSARFRRIPRGEGPRHTLITPTAGAADPASGAREVKAGGRGRFT